MNSQSTPRTSKELLALIIKDKPSVSESVLDIVYKSGKYLETASAIPSINKAIEALMKQPNADISDEKKSRHMRILLDLATFLDELKTSVDWFKSQSGENTLDTIRDGAEDDE